MRASLRRAARVAATVAVGVAGVAVLAGGDAAPPVRVALQDGAAWVASPSLGQLTLIDGRSAEVAARVEVGPPTETLEAVQAGPAGFAVDRGAGTVVRVDPTTLLADDPVTVIEGAAGGLTAFAADEALYVLDGERGRIVVTDPDDVARVKSGPQSLAEQVGSSVVDDAGRLWLLGAASGDLTWFDGTERGERAAVTEGPDTAELVVIDGRAAVVDRAARTVRALDGGGFGDEACIEMDPGDETIQVAGSPRAARLYAVSGADGLLRMSDLDAGDCDELAATVAEPGHLLGRPQESAGRVFVPDFTTGTVAVVDPENPTRVVNTDELVEPGGEFELFGEDGIVFYNDPASEKAGVVNVDGSFSPVAKFDPDNPTAGLSTDIGPGGDAAGPDPQPGDTPPGDQPDDAGGPAPGGTDAADPEAPADGDPGLVGGVDPRGDDPSPQGPDEDPPDDPGPADPDPADPDPADPDPPDPGPGTAPAISGLSVGAGVYEVGQAITVSATVTGGFTTCSWDLQGLGTAGCDPATAGAGAVTVTGTFSASSPGDYTLTLNAGNATGTDSATATVTVTAAPPPQQPPTVTNITGGGQYNVGDTITLTAVIDNGFTSCFVSAPPLAQGVPCSPGSGGPGPVTVSVSFSASGAADVQASFLVENGAGPAANGVGIVVVAPNPTDTTPPSVSITGSSFPYTSATTADLTVTATASDPESGIGSISVDGTVTWQCQSVNPMNPNTNESTALPPTFGSNGSVNGRWGLEFLCPANYVFVSFSATANVTVTAVNGEGLSGSASRTVPVTT